MIYFNGETMMKTVLAVTFAAIAASLSASVVAAGDHDGHGAMHAPAAAADHEGHGSMHGGAPDAAAMADGLVKKVDKPGGKLTISHGPLPNGMPAMTMAYRVKESAWLEQLKVGERIRFSTDEGMTTIVRFERVK